VWDHSANMGWVVPDAKQAQICRQASGRV
jgi:hypothetical protein